MDVNQIYVPLTKFKTRMCKFLTKKENSLLSYLFCQVFKILILFLLGRVYGNLWASFFLKKYNLNCWGEKYSFQLLLIVKKQNIQTYLTFWKVYFFVILSCQKWLNSFLWNFIGWSIEFSDLNSVFQTLFIQWKYLCYSLF